MGFLLVSFHSILANILQTKIRNVDKKWNQTKSGDLGPAAQFYATIPKGVIGLGAGSFGETGRGIQEHHALIANHASTIVDDQQGHEPLSATSHESRVSSVQDLWARASKMWLLGELGILLFCSPGFWDVEGLLRALSSPGG